MNQPYEINYLSVKKMEYRKENKFAFDEARKESFIGRLKQLIGSRSVRASAKEWGLSFSTLNNYITRGTEPSFVAMQAIAHAERVSLDWLAFGTGDAKMNHGGAIEADENQSTQTTPALPLRDRWVAVFDSLETKDIEALLKLIYSRGVLGVISLAGVANDLDQMLVGLPEEEKERLMALHEAKKGASENSELDITQSPASDDKRQAS
ncbi:helix-turn-helix domain-containing protein [Pantoea sp. BAV 3049]|uniref:helix-turn-helix domain-containing protein n=1 Tax=Pantoea sp. BAV 3049 TaxID=2654188 RepID=UPI001E480D1D|nr:helix-turn-helix domain-containing protein [Pantoea sp. BAV 3049]